MYGTSRNKGMYPTLRALKGYHTLEAFSFSIHSELRNSPYCQSLGVHHTLRASGCTIHRYIRLWSAPYGPGFMYLRATLHRELYRTLKYMIVVDSVGLAVYRKLKAVDSLHSGKRISSAGRRCIPRDTCVVTLHKQEQHLTTGTP